MRSFGFGKRPAPGPPARNNGSSSSSNEAVDPEVAAGIENLRIAQLNEIAARGENLVGEAADYARDENGNYHVSDPNDLLNAEDPTVMEDPLLQEAQGQEIKERDLAERQRQDEKFVNSAPADIQTELLAAIAYIMDLNGKGYTPGQAASYIPERAYFQMFAIPGMTPEMSKALILAYNWDALGRGISGVAGAAIRFALRNHFDRGREYTMHKVLPAGFGPIILAYNRQVARDPEIHKFFTANAISVAALAGAMMNRIDHHWDAHNTRAQAAMLSAMGMSDKIERTVESFRPIFYLAIHPLPLIYTEEVRRTAAVGQLPEVAEVVRLRCMGPPAGFGAFNACAASVTSLLNEPFLDVTKFVDVPLRQVVDVKNDEHVAAVERHNKSAERTNRLNTMRRNKIPIIRSQLEMLREDNRTLVANAGQFHIRAKAFGFAERKTMDVERHKETMIICAAYIFSKIKGTLAESAALKKFRNENARKITLGISALNDVSTGETLEDFLGIMA